MKLPQYFYEQTPEEAYKSLTINQKYRTKLALIKYRKFVQNQVKPKSDYEISNDISGFINGIAFQGKEEEVISKRREEYAEPLNEDGTKRDHWRIINKADKTVNFISNKIIRHCCGEDKDRPNGMPNSSSMAVIRDYLVWQKALDPRSLDEPINEVLAVYSIVQDIAPLAGFAIPEEFSTNNSDWFLIPHGKNPYKIYYLQLSKLASGAYKVSIKFQATQRVLKFRFGKDDSVMGWFFTSNNVSIGALKPPPNDGQRIVFNIMHSGQNNETYALHISFCPTESELSDCADRNNFINQNMRLVENFAQTSQNMYNNGSENNNLAGGTRYAQARELGGIVYEEKSEKELGRELVNLLYKNVNPFQDEKVRQDLFDRTLALIKIGASLDVPHEKSGFYPLHYLMGGFYLDHLDEVFKRDDINYLHKTPKGELACQVTDSVMDMAGEEDWQYNAILTRKTQDQIDELGHEYSDHFGWQPEYPDFGRNM